MRSNQRFEYWKRLRAPGWPYFLRSFMRGSRVRKPSALRVERRLASNCSKARAMPCRTAPAWPVGPPPVTVTGTSDKLDVKVNVTGGGPNGQAGAVRHGIARALLQFDANLRPSLKAEGFLTRDPRMRERKKYGQPGARKRFQFSKR